MISHFFGLPFTTKPVGLQAYIRLIRNSVSLAAFLFASLVSYPLSAQVEGRDNYAVLIGGLGGSPEYTQTFRQYLYDSRESLIENFGLAAQNITVLAEPSLAGESFVTNDSKSENIIAVFEELSSSLDANDQLLVIFFGHGSYNGDEAFFNIPRKDLSASEYADLLYPIKAGRKIVINTAPASSPFIDALSGEDYIILTATRRASQRNETIFPSFFVEALSSSASDLDKNGDISIAELFTYASELTARNFEETQHLATEHALIDDNGDGEGTRVQDLQNSPDGNLASITYLKRGDQSFATSSPVDREWINARLSQKDTFEQEIASIKSRKNQMSESEYYAELESVFVQLAQLNDQIESRTSPQ